MTHNGSFLIRTVFMKIIDFFKENHITLTNKNLLVAASAGPDSMALLDMLRKLSKENHFKVIAAHFNHQLRDDSEKESQLLRKYCTDNNLPLFIKKWDKNEQPQSGIEAAARHARYAFLTKVAKENQADYLLTAHHGDDLLENILLKFIRSGNPEEMNSLQAIGMMHGIKLLRPLLAYSKQELLNYDQRMKIDFIVDSTNRADETMRNRLRHHIVPLLKQENPNLIENALFFSHKMDELVDLVDKKIASIGQVEPIFGDAYRIKSKYLTKLSIQEKNIFWQKVIWQKYHRRVNSNFGNFTVTEYQHYFYLYSSQKIRSIVKQNIKLNQPFVFQNRKLLLTSEKRTDLSLVGDFWFNPETKFDVGSLPSGTKLLLQDGHHVKAKKKFAEKAIPSALRPLCLTIYVENEPIFVEKIYQNQNWIKNGKHYFLYNF